MSQCLLVIQPVEPVMQEDQGPEEVLRRKLKIKHRWSIMFLARAADTEAFNTAKKEKMQVTIG